jgi:hypothetical protein
MAYTIIDPIFGAQGIAEVSTTKRHPLGLIVRAVDPTYGAGEFIYLQGVASTVRGSWVQYNADDFGTTLAVANDIGPKAIAMAAVVASRYGWYQISGKAVGKALASYADNGLVFLTSTAGSVDDAVVDGDMVHLAKGASAVDTPETGLAEFEISRPYTDDITTND